jgi:hypothetical protein
MKRASLLLLFFCFGISAFAQYEASPVARSVYPDSTYSAKISFSVIDIVTRQPVSGCTVTLRDTGNTPLLTFTLDSVFDTTLVFKNLCGYYVTISKPGYDTLFADWWTIERSNEYFIDFYMRKENLTKEEKKIAVLKSHGVPSHRPEMTDQGGFEKVGPGKKEILEWKVEEYGPEGSRGSVHSLRKVKSLD